MIAGGSFAFSFVCRVHVGHIVNVLEIAIFKRMTTERCTERRTLSIQRYVRPVKCILQVNRSEEMNQEICFLKRQ